MEDFAILLILLAIVCILSGPVALIISIIALNKTKELFRQIQKKGVFIAEPPAREPVEVPKPKEVAITPSPGKEQLEAKEEKPLPQVAKVPEIKKKAMGTSKTGTLEQRIGTRWILVAGVITVFVGVGFFLKYAYEHFSLSLSARVIIVAICGLVALAAGEITRRRGYDIVAKGVTALGFAILYAAILFQSLGSLSHESLYDRPR